MDIRGKVASNEQKASFRYTIYVPLLNKILDRRDEGIVGKVLQQLKKGATARAECKGIWTNASGKVCEDEIVPIEVVLSDDMNHDDYITSIAKHVAALMGHDWVFVTKDVVYVIRHASTILAKEKIIDARK